jgi:hypothetical protein
VSISFTKSFSSGISIAVGSKVTDGYNEAFFALLDSKNEVLWQKNTSGGGHYGNNATSAAVDKEGNIYILGNHSGTLAIDGKTLASQGVSNMFVLKYTSDGNLLWMKQAQGEGFENRSYGESIEIQEEEIVVTGSATGKVLFNEKYFDQNDKYEARYDKNGNLLALKAII